MPTAIPSSSPTTPPPDTNTPVPTATPTQIPTNTTPPNPTPPSDPAPPPPAFIPPPNAPFIEISGVCSENPNLTLRWRVVAPAGLALAWDIYGSEQRGELVMPQSGE
ncbi:MAG: hypothetical protein EBZ48_11985, partial [Proteobacteria bacterium]|nr:hypothetical protein [Pseudomonadota bacterium]